MRKVSFMQYANSEERDQLGDRCIMMMGTLVVDIISSGPLLSAYGRRTLFEGCAASRHNNWVVGLKDRGFNACWVKISANFRNIFPVFSKK